MDHDPAAGLGALVDRLRQAMAGAAPAPEPGPFVGEANEGKVHAEVSADGRLLALTVDPTMARDGVEEICRTVVLAVNEALAARPDQPSTAPLLEELRNVQEESVAEMGRITSAFTDALNRASAR